MIPNNVLSNEIEDFQGGGIYPGGTGQVTDIRYVLWDYDGKQPPDSVCAVKLSFQPTDGSNEGKVVEIFWSAGSGKEATPSPNGGFLIPTGARTAQSDNSNWAGVVKALRDNCGLPKGQLSTDAGITALAGSELTLARIEQKHRDGLDNQKEGARKPTILVPTRAKFAWEKRGAGAATAATRPANSAAPVNGTPASSPTPGGAVSNTITDTSEILLAILADNGGEVEVSQIAKLIMGAMPNHDKLVRTNTMKDAKANLGTIAAGSGWTLADGKLTL